MNAHRTVRFVGTLSFALVLLTGLLIAPEPAPLSAGTGDAPIHGKLTSIVPPPIEVAEKARRGEVSLPPMHLYKASPSPVKPRPLQSNVHLLAILVDFSDNPATVTANLTAFDNLVFAPPGPAQGSVRDYYAAASFGQVDLVTVHMPSTTGWQPAPQTYAYYVNNYYGWGGYPNNAGRMVEDILPIIDPLVDFSHYDNDGDGWVDSLLVIHAGTGAEFSLSTGHIWSHASSISLMGGNPVFRDNVWLDSYVTVPEYLDPSMVTIASTDMTIGVISHEIAHGLWGLPDLYDVDSSSYGIGQWGLMGYGTWNGPLKWNPYQNYSITDGSSPALLSAWSRLVTGFDSYAMALSPMQGCLPAAETLPGTILRFKSSALKPQEYFLVENRQQFPGGLPGYYDQWLPGSGLLIWHVDEAMWSIYGGPDNNSECTTVPHCSGACWGTHYLVALEQADGVDNLENLINSGDVGDPFPGSSSNTIWQWYGHGPTNPESGTWYDTGCATDSCIDVTNIAVQPNTDVCLTVQQAYCTQMEADLGDAPTSLNNHGPIPMTAYLPDAAFPNVQANFPTVFWPGTPNLGPRHHFSQIDSWLGYYVTAELDADLTPGQDQDLITNIDPPSDTPDMDSVSTPHGFDDGVPEPVLLADCAPVNMPFTVTVASSSLFGPMPRFVNVWFDWNRDGDWNDMLVCPDGLLAPEWAVADQWFMSGPGVYQMGTFPFVPKITIAEDSMFQTWMRISLSEMQAPAPFDGSGPVMGYDLGETEDYRLFLDPILQKMANLTGDPAPGDQVTYEIHYDASGNVEASGVVISDVLPSGIEYVSSNPPGTYDPATRAVTWTVTLTPFQPQILDLVVDVTGSPSDTITNTAYMLWGNTIWKRSPFEFEIACDPDDPQADFRWSPPVCLSETVTFLNQSSGTEPMSYSWDLDGDGLPDSTEEDPTWQYGMTGTYTVTLSVTNTYGCTDIHSDTVTVEDTCVYRLYLPTILNSS